MKNCAYILIALVWQIATTPAVMMAMAQEQTNVSAASSLQEIKDREAEITRQKTSIDWWNYAQITFIILAAIAASGLVVTGLVLNSKGKALTKTEDNLAETKDRNAAADSQIKSLQIATAQRSAAEANEHAKQLEKQTEELKNENLELQRRINPRFLTASERKAILSGIGPFRGHQILVDRLGDGEAGPYGDSIIEVFKQAGWVVQVNSIGSYSPPIYGIVCQTSSNPDEGTKAIIAAFRDAGIGLTLKHLPAAPQESWIEMFVGLKPIN